MSTPYGAPTSAQLDSLLPKGDLLGRFDSYLDAQKLVDYLADNNFPVSNVSIVGNDLKMVERVTAKLSYPKVALSGAAQGALFGAFVGLILSIFGTGDMLQVLTSVVLGMAIWMIFGVITYSMRRGKRDFASSQQVLATSYDVVVAFEQAHAARALAAKLPMRGNFASQGGGFAHQAPVNQPPFSAQPTDSFQTSGASQGDGTPQRNGASGGASSTNASEPSQGLGQDTPPMTSYSDLPDGRPQYGIRVDPANPSSPKGEGPQDGDQDLGQQSK
ncbi:general stress protein [Neomicrococcus lactis]|uniref:general stress protein n=1 Tax=Neomicrococcus lactis TaxID=732241 RepID=UPI002301BD66|nr:general stress protein [Neomicrococcus lactis]